MRDKSNFHPASPAPNKLVVELYLPQLPEQKKSNRLDGRRQLVQEACEKLLTWLNEQNSEFEISPDPSQQPLIPIFVIKTRVNSLVEKLLDEPSRPTFIRTAEFSQEYRLSIPQPEESFE